MAGIFLRFVAMDPEREPDRPKGVFGAAYDVLYRGEVAEYLQTEIQNLLDWFVEELPIPQQFSRRRNRRRKDTGLCWFKSEALDCLKNVRYLVYLIKECGIPVQEIRIDTPGYFIYEDPFQVVAEPFQGKPSSTQRS